MPLLFRALRNLIVVAMLFAAAFFFSRREKLITGTIFDCETQQPIPNATVWLEQIGWGMRDGQLVWDKMFRTDTVTAPDGSYTLKFRVGNSAHVNATFEGYLVSEGWVEPGSHARVGLLKDKSQSTGYRETVKACKLSKDCLKTSVENGVVVARDICPNF